MELRGLQAEAGRASDLLKALGNAHRLVILCELMGGERSVGELVRRVGLSQSALSQHLARLRRDELVRTRRAAQTIYYSLSGHHARAVIETLDRLYGQDGAGRGGEGRGRTRRIRA
jgi:ArsR family transcriptional regulator, virulence genes transcriptional regulator